jgi:hypothetical protein
LLKKIDRNFWILWVEFFIFTAIPDYRTYQRCLALHDYRGAAFLTIFHMVLPFLGLLVYYSVCSPDQRRSWDAWLVPARRKAPPSKTEVDKDA